MNDPNWRSGLDQTEGLEGQATKETGATIDTRTQKMGRRSKNVTWNTPNDCVINFTLRGIDLQNRHKTSTEKIRIHTQQARESFPTLAGMREQLLCTNTHEWKAPNQTLIHQLQNTRWIRNEKGHPITDFHKENPQIWRVRGGHKESGDSVWLQTSLMDDRRGQVPKLHHVQHHQKSQQRTSVAECTATLEGKYNERLKIFTDGSLKDERVGYAIVTPETMIKNRMRSQTTIFSAEQEAIIKAIYISKGKGANVIVTDSFNTMMKVRDGQKPKDETNKAATSPRKRKGQTDVDTEPLRNRGEQKSRWGGKERVGRRHQRPRTLPTTRPNQLNEKLTGRKRLTQKTDKKSGLKEKTPWDWERKI
jgi:hypothetical protein